METHRIRRDMSVLSEQLGAPDVGFIPVNAFVLRAAEPVVVGTGLSLLDRNFRPSFSAVMHPADLRWRVLTHRDHAAGCSRCSAASRGRIVTTFLSAGYMSAERPIRPDRLYLLNPRHGVRQRVQCLRQPLPGADVTIPAGAVGVVGAGLATVSARASSVDSVPAELWLTTRRVWHQGEPL
jgi:hypothetical protein